MIGSTSHWMTCGNPYFKKQFNLNLKIQTQQAGNGQGTKFLNYINMDYINIQDGTILIIAKIMPH